ncbi:hypothetical protein [Umezawaea beigongshangensis]|uniref:hypothetical protein n=1 Tax=Umezawaea beigongshangensis TaxID=2780383 RepID=UPI001E51BD22|nr:hypothetical protein [Umezawaea beigongshangensis]
MTENDRSGTPGTPGTGRNDDNTTTPPPYVPAGQEQPTQAPGARGSIRNQEAGVTRARPESLADKRARQQAEAAELVRRQEADAEFERKAKLRKRLLVGSGVTVGVVALVAVWYAVASPREVTAQCTDSSDVIVDDDYCDQTYYSSHGGYSSGGFIYIGGNSYRYNYGGAGTVGQKVSGGSYTAPKGANVSTKSGTTIQRGGFGVSGGSKSGGS